MVKKRTKQEMERFVFAAFREVCPLKFAGEPESRRTPEPDILCSLKSGEQLAFELTQIDDPNYVRLGNTAFDLNEELRAARKKLVNPERFHGYSISVTFRDHVKFADRPNCIPQVIQILNERGPVSSHSLLDKGKNIGAIRCEDVPLVVEMGR